MAHPPLFKVTKGTKSAYIKNEKDLEKYILKSSDNGAKKLKKADLEKFISDQKQKLSNSGIELIQLKVSILKRFFPILL